METVTRKRWTWNEIECYLTCPRRYRYHKLYKPEFTPLEDAFSLIMHRILDRIVYSGISRYNTVPLRQFNRIWSSEWRRIHKEKNVQSCGKSLYLTLLLRGERYLRNFYIRFKSLCANDIHPQGVVHNFYYDANIPGGYVIRGKMDLVYPVRGGAIILKFRMEDKANTEPHPTVDTIHAALDREIMLWAIGFRSTLIHPPYMLKHFYLCDGQEIDIQPEEKDYRRMRTYFSGVCASMHYTSRRQIGDHCFNCPYQKICSQEEEESYGYTEDQSSIPDSGVEQQDTVR